jgi:beta-phosphoglucomutase family hydrolase
MLGLPDRIRACLFDVDGVLTPTAALHARAWKRMFDAFLADRPEAGAPFDLEQDYDQYVDGRPRDDGARAFLASRRIRLPEGRPTDPAGAPTVEGLAKRKDEFFLESLRSGRIEPYVGSTRYVRAARTHGLRTAVVTSSVHGRQVLEAAGISDLFDVRVDGLVSEAHHLRGKPAPDAYLDAARQLDVRADDAAVFEDALAGVEAGRAGGFGFVVGVDRVGQGAALAEHGADVVVGDLAQLLQGR